MLSKLGGEKLFFLLFEHLLEHLDLLFQIAMLRPCCREHFVQHGLLRQCLLGFPLAAFLRVFGRLLALPQLGPECSGITLSLLPLLEETLFNLNKMRPMVNEHIFAKSDSSVLTRVGISVELMAWA